MNNTYPITVTGALIEEVEVAPLYWYNWYPINNTYKVYKNNSLITDIYKL